MFNSMGNVNKQLDKIFVLSCILFKKFEKKTFYRLKKNLI